MEDFITPGDDGNNIPDGNIKRDFNNFIDDITSQKLSVVDVDKIHVTDNILRDNAIVSAVWEGDDAVISHGILKIEKIRNGYLEDSYNYIFISSKHNQLKMNICDLIFNDKIEKLYIYPDDIGNINPLGDMHLGMN